MKVLVINAVSDLPERALYRGLKHSGVEIKLVLDPRDEFLQDASNLGIAGFELKIKHRFDLNAIKKIRTLLKAEKYDLIYAPASRGLSVALLAARGLDMRFVTYRGTQGNLSLLNPAVLIAHRNPRVDKIICNCHAVHEYLASLHIPSKKLQIVYKGHEVDWYKPKQILSRNDFNLGEKDFVVGMIANIRPLKGTDVLFAALAEIKRDVPVKCLLVGEGDKNYLARLISRYELQDTVQHLGFRKDIPEIISLCDLTVMPSVRREGVPRAMIESMSNAVPVVVTSIGGMKEIVKDGVSGLVVPPADPKALASALTKLYLEPKLRQSMGQAALEHVKNELTVEKYVSSMCQVFASVVNDADMSDKTQCHADQQRCV